MTKPTQFILNTSYATLKNDDSGSGSVVVPSSVNIAGSGSVSYSTDLTIGAQGAFTRARIRSSKEGSRWIVANAIGYIRTGTTLGSPAIYDIFAFVWRPNATTLRLQVHIQNPYSSTLTTASGAETIDFFVNTFLPPF